MAHLASFLLEVYPVGGLCQKIPDPSYTNCQTI
jgi:hypothetical protein